MKLTYLVTFVIMFYDLMVHAQTMSKESVTWKKRIVRIVDMQAQKDTVQRTLAIAKDSTFIDVLVDAFNHNQLTIFAARDGAPAEIIKNGELKYHLPIRCGIDTEVVRNATTGEDEIRIKMPADFNYNDFHKFEILEEWSFYPGTGKTDIKLLAIAPGWDVFDDDRVFRGFNPFFYVNYLDAVAILKRYARDHPSNTFAEKIWKDYFQSDTKPTH